MKRYRIAIEAVEGVRTYDQRMQYKTGSAAKVRARAIARKSAATVHVEYLMLGAGGWNTVYTVARYTTISEQRKQWADDYPPTSIRGAI